MSIVKLDLHNKNIAEKIQSARAVLTKLGTPPPTAYTALAAALKTATDKLEADSNSYDASESTTSGLLTVRDTSESAFDAAFGALGGQVQVTTKGDPTAINDAGFDVRAQASTPPDSLDAVHAFTVTTSNESGVFDFTWDKLDGAKTYELRGRKQSDPAGQYSYTKTTTKTRLRAGGFDSGGAYEFSIRAHGAGEAESPWSAPFPKTAS
jgi:hypothetical protein